MICEKCKREIGPEEIKCRYCGADNPFSIQHRNNMEQFGREYGRTRKNVLDSAWKTGGLAKRAEILAALIIGCIIMAVIASLNYADPAEDTSVRKDGEKNAAKYAVEAEAYLERGEYMEYMDFLYKHQLRNFMPEEFDHLKGVTYVADSYYRSIRELESIILRSDDPDYFDGLNTDIVNFCRSVEGFYEVAEVWKNSKRDESYHVYIEDIQAELEAAMRTYFDMDDKELEEFVSASETKKAVILEEVFRDE